MSGPSFSGAAQPHDHGEDHDHGAAHDHLGNPPGHAHGHHHHAPAKTGRAFAIGVALNFAFVVIEVAFGVIGGSIALIADAGHNLGDALGLLGAWGANAAAARAPTRRFTYGYGRASILAALGNAIVLLVTVGGIGWAAIERLAHPAPVASTTMIVVALCGIAVNGATALLFARGRKGDLNIRAAFVHMVADAGLSAAVVVAGLIIMETGWTWADPLMSLVLCAVIVWGTWGLLRDSVSMSMDAVPPGVDPGEVRHMLETLPGVDGVHDLHIWALSTRRTALTCHLVMYGGHPGDDFIVEVAAAAHRRFGIDHTTVQIETDAETRCALVHEHAG